MRNPNTKEDGWAMHDQISLTDRKYGTGYVLHFAPDRITLLIGRVIQPTSHGLVRFCIKKFHSYN